MKRKWLAIIGIVILLFGGSLAITRIDFDNLIRTPVKGNVIFDCKDLNITDINAMDARVSVTGELNDKEYDYLKVYIIGNTEAEKKKDKLYITVTGGYGTGEELKKFCVEEQFDGEEINKIILKGKGFSSKVIWSRKNNLSK